ncbi:MAG: hypothetical protein HKN47_07430 [Pirellulaceae bacterium]|nr:hypothetical protein [Pirellulaceae bacterium]
MRFLFLSVLLVIPSSFASSQDLARNPFAVTENDDAPTSHAGNAQRGSVTFAFDGGTLLCTFGRIGSEGKRSAAMILFPSTAKMQIERNLLKQHSDQHGSVVIVVEPDGKKTQLFGDTVHKWAKARVANASSRDSAIEEHAFVATVVHALSTGTPLSVWGSDAQDLLESGQWCKLFAGTKVTLPLRKTDEP